MPVIFEDLHLSNTQTAEKRVSNSSDANNTRQGRDIPEISNSSRAFMYQKLISKISRDMQKTEPKGNWSVLDKKFFTVFAELSRFTLGQQKING